jgi:hypothetical protein
MDVLFMLFKVEINGSMIDYLIRLEVTLTFKLHLPSKMSSWFSNLQQQHLTKNTMWEMLHINLLEFHWQNMSHGQSSNAHERHAHMEIHRREPFVLLMYSPETYGSPHPQSRFCAYKPEKNKFSKMTTEFNKFNYELCNWKQLLYGTVKILDYQPWGSKFESWEEPPHAEILKAGTISKVQDLVPMTQLQYDDNKVMTLIKINIV